MTYVEFAINAVQYFADNSKDQRFGQAVYNYLHAVRPDIADRICDTPLDPFHQTFVADEVWAEIRRLWEEVNVP